MGYYRGNLQNRDRYEQARRNIADYFGRDYNKNGLRNGNEKGMGTEDMYERLANRGPHTRNYNSHVHVGVRHEQDPNAHNHNNDDGLSHKQPGDVDEQTRNVIK